MTTDSEQRVSGPSATYDIAPSPIDIDQALATLRDSGEVAKPIGGGGYRNPNSLANLQPPFTSENNPRGAGSTGPILTPKLRKMAEMDPAELEALLKAGKLKAAERAAATWWLDSFTSGVRYGTGHHSRAQLADRLDGPVNKQEVNVNIGVVIRGYGELDEGSIG